MRTRTRWLVLATVALAGCADGDGVTDPAGPGAHRTANLWWFLFVVVLVLAVVCRRHRGPDTPEVDHDAPSAMRWVLGGGVLLPALVLPVTFGVTLWTMAEDADAHGELTVEVTGRQWFWDVLYAGTGAVTANEIHIPVDVPVRFLLRSDDVAHSFWVPQLAGKIDLIPGETNELVLEADEPGTYTGRCAEFCGLQHTNMRFIVVADEPADFEEWLAEQEADAALPDDAVAAKGLEVFQSSCSYCHTDRGTGITGDVGPDLTHVSRRRQLAAVIATQYCRFELQALLAYLETLR